MKRPETDPKVGAESVEGRDGWQATRKFADKRCINQSTRQKGVAANRLGNRGATLQLVDSKRDVGLSRRRAGGETTSQGKVGLASSPPRKFSPVWTDLGYGAPAANDPDSGFDHQGGAA